MRNLNSKNPLGLTVLLMKEECNIYKQQRDGTFLPCYLSDVSRTHNKKTLFIISRNPQKGEVCLMDKGEIMAIVNKEKELNEKVKQSSEKISKAFIRKELIRAHISGRA